MTSSLIPGTALVTGASSGIGTIYAEKLARRGFDLVLVGRNEQALSALATRLTGETGQTVEILPADLSQESGIAAVEQKLQADTRLTLLVNNAGSAANGPLASVETKALSDMLTTNVVALSRLAAGAAAAFTARQRGAIINLASAMAFIDTPQTAGYAASKAYVLNFSLALDLELAPQGIQVQVVLPGYTRTPMIDLGRQLPPEIVMDANALVDAALDGFDRGELVTIPSLEDQASYDNWAAARTAMQPFLSLAQPASRYRN